MTIWTAWITRRHPPPPPSPARGEGAGSIAMKLPLPPCGGGLGWGVCRRAKLEGGAPAILRPERRACRLADDLPSLLARIPQRHHRVIDVEAALRHALEIID